MSRAFNAVIDFILDADEGLEYLRWWREGSFDTCREHWPEAPEACYEGLEVGKPGFIPYNDTELLDWLGREASESRTGVSLVRANLTEDGQVLDRGYRVYRHHKIFRTCPTLRQAIVAAIAGET